MLLVFLFSINYEQLGSNAGVNLGSEIYKSQVPPWQCRLKNLNQELSQLQTPLLNQPASLWLHARGRCQRTVPLHDRAAGAKALQLTPPSNSRGTADRTRDLNQTNFNNFMENTKANESFVRAGFRDRLSKLFQESNQDAHLQEYQANRSDWPV